MRLRRQSVRGYQTGWRFGTRDDALEHAYPSTRQRVAAAGAGIVCAIVLYSWAVPSTKQRKSEATGAATFAHIVPDALRALTGLASAVRSGSAQRSSPAPGAGIRN